MRLTLARFSGQTLAIRETILVSIQKRLSNVIVESDSQIVIRVITSDIKTPNQICNIIADIIVLASAIKNIEFICCNISPIN